MASTTCEEQGGGELASVGHLGNGQISRPKFGIISYLLQDARLFQTCLKHCYCVVRDVLVMEEGLLCRRQPSRTY